MTPIMTSLLPRVSRRLHVGRQIVAVAMAAAAFALITGCATEPESTHPSDTTKYTLEDTDRFTNTAQHAVSCTGLMEVPMADGRMEIVANLKNRENQKVNVQASCVYRDPTGVTVEETPWQTVTLPENGTVAVRFAAAKATTKNYTVRVRDVR